MTRSEMLIYFRELYGLSSHTNDGKLDDEIDIYFNLAQDQIIEENLIENNDMLIRSIKGNLKSHNVINSLLVKSDSLTLSSDAEFANVFLADIPSSAVILVRYVLQGRCQLTRNLTNPVQGWYGTKTIATVDIDKYVYNGNNNPYLASPLLTFTGGKMAFIINNEDVLNDAKVEYIKEPVAIGSVIATVVQDCELHVSVHKELVNKAVNIALKSSSIEPFQKIGVELQENKQ